MRSLNRFVALLAGLMILSACQATATSTATNEPAAADLREVPVSHVEVQVGVGSPIPVDVFVSGSWPDLCAQLAETQHSLANGRIEISLLATPADPTCPPDYLGLPFRIAIPINFVELPEGEYTVVVNGVSTTFDWRQGDTPPTVPMMTPAQIDEVNIEIEGSRAVKSVHALVSGRLPDTCAQISETNVSREGASFYIVVLTSSPGGQGCVADGLPFQLKIPLNITNLPAGPYTVNVNGVTASFDPQDTPSTGGAGASGSINGWVWHDRCDSGLDGQPAPTSTPPGCVEQASPLGNYHADGVLNADEPPIESVVVKLGQGACPAVGLAETTTLATDLSYSFTGLAAGTYCVSIDPQQEPNFTLLRPGVWTYPDVTEGLVGSTVTLQPGENKFDVNFGWDYQFK